MWWGKSQDKPDPAKQTEPQQAKGASPAERATQFDPKLPKRERLPDGLQKIVDKADKEENVFDEIVEG